MKNNKNKLSATEKFQEDIKIAMKIIIDKPSQRGLKEE